MTLKAAEGTDVSSCYNISATVTVLPITLILFLLPGWFPWSAHSAALKLYTAPALVCENITTAA